MQSCPKHVQDKLLIGMRLALVFCLLLLPVSLFALTPNIPAGTLVSKNVISTRDGLLNDAVINSPDPVIPAIARQQRSRGVYVVEISVVRGIVDNVRVLQSSGNKILDDAVIEALLKWRFRPRSVYKVTVPIDVGISGRIRIGS
jgi:TonB family protein